MPGNPPPAGPHLRGSASVLPPSTPVSVWTKSRPTQQAGRRRLSSLALRRLDHSGWQIRWIATLRSAARYHLLEASPHHYQILCWQRLLSLHSLRPCRSHSQDHPATPDRQTVQCWRVCSGFPGQAGLGGHQTHPFGPCRVGVVCQLSERPSCHRSSCRFSRARAVWPADYSPVPSSSAEMCRSPSEVRLPPDAPSAWEAQSSGGQKTSPPPTSAQVLRPAEAAAP